jgi:hypothetical protein
MIQGDVETRRMKLTELNQASYNPRKISDASLDGLGASLETFGLLSLIIWNKRSGNMVGGHQRYRKLLEIGETETDVVVVDLDDDSEIALNIMLNNKFTRGDYTSDIKVMLEKVEVQIGSIFNDLRLNDLHEKINKVADRVPKGSKDYDGEYSPPVIQPLDGDDDDDDDAVVITCPECDSVWRMNDEKILKNNNKEECE